jgi:hypothetical protein
LGWTRVPGADVYRLQIATRQSDPSDAVVFRHPALTELSLTNAYSLLVIGRQFYYWRVQAQVHGAWGRYVRSMHFLVAMPTVARPHLLSPGDGTSVTATRLRLCWTSVKGAAGYTLQVSGIPVRNPQTGRCARVFTPPGRYRWRVAALIRGVRVYTGPYSQTRQFTVRAQPTPTPRPTPTPMPTPTAAPTATAAPAPTSRPQHRAKRQHQAKRPALAPTPAARPTARPTSTPSPTKTATPLPRLAAIALKFDKLQLSVKATGRVGVIFPVNRPLLLVAVYTVRHLSAPQTASIRVAYWFLPPGQLQFLSARVHKEPVPINGTYRFVRTTSFHTVGRFRIVVIIRIGHVTRARVFNLRVTSQSGA